MPSTALTSSSYRMLLVVITVPRPSARQAKMMRFGAGAFRPHGVSGGPARRRRCRGWSEGSRGGKRAASLIQHRRPVAGDYPSSDFAISAEGTVRRIVHTPSGMTIVTAQVLRDPVAVLSTYTVEATGSGGHYPQEIAQAARGAVSTIGRLVPLRSDRRRWLDLCGAYLLPVYRARLFGHKVVVKRRV
jgi:hypothetical protein